ncbi:MAG: hypothetical protein QXP72_00095 [Desulfurococcaceae archaeon]
MIRYVDKLLFVRVSSSVLLALALVILNLNTIAWLNTLDSKTEVSYSFNPITCFSMYKLISEKYETVQIGRSDTDKYSIDKLVFKYTIDNIGDVSIRVDVYKPLNRNYIEKYAILIHDFGQDPRSLTWLTINLVNRGFIVVVPDNRVNIYGTKLELFSRNPYESWIYLTMMNTKKIVSYISKTSFNTANQSINILGVGFGGLVAVLTGVYDSRIHTSISIGNVFSIRRSIEKGGFIVFYINSSNDINPCYDPTNVVKHSSSRILVITGLFDEISSYGEYINDIIKASNVKISVIPNRGRYNEVPDQWLNFAMDYLEGRDGNENSGAKVFFKTDILKTSIHVEDHYDRFIVLHRPAIPGFSWRVKNVESSTIEFHDFLIPTEYIVVNRDNYIIVNNLKKGSILGLIISIIYVPLWILINKSLIKKFLRKRLLSYIVLIINTILLFYHSIPSFLAVGYYHISIIELSELLHSYVLFIPYFTIFIIFSQPALYVITLLHNDKYRTIYLIIPLLTISIYYTILLHLTTIFESKIVILPTITLALIVASIILNMYESSSTKQ